MEKKIIDLYNSGIGSYKISKNFNISTYKIYKILKQKNVYIRNDKEKNKTIFNERYFSSIDSEAKAYFLGLLAADGQVQKNKHSSILMRIDLMEEDKYILENFAVELGFSVDRVKIYKRKLHFKNIARLIAYSDTLGQDLANFNIVPRKTFSYSWPCSIPKNFERDFIRGYFDGDGCITTGPTIKIVGTKQFLLKVQDVLYRECGTSKTKLQTRHKNRNNNTRSLENGGRKKVQIIFDYLYDGANLFLKRKKKKFLILLNNG